MTSIFLFNAIKKNSGITLKSNSGKEELHIKIPAPVLFKFEFYSDNMVLFHEQQMLSEALSFKLGISMNLSI